MIFLLSLWDGREASREKNCFIGKASCRVMQTVQVTSRMRAQKSMSNLTAILYKTSHMVKARFLLLLIDFS